MKTKTWTLEVEEDPLTGEAVLTFPPDILEAAGWSEGDAIVWDIQSDGKSYILTKKNE